MKDTDLTQFSDLGLAEPILHAVAREGYDTATPIQAQVIPSMLQGNDVLGIAQTGTGKTAAFVLPLLNALAQEKGDNHKAFVPRAPKSAKALILVPTRELAQQIAIAVKTYGRHLKPNVAVVVGGASIGVQAKMLAKGVDILVATPGRLEDHMRSKAVTLAHTTHVVLDEADQMLDMGFIPAMRRILDAVASPRQTVLLSATMPKQLAALAKDFQESPDKISVAPQSKPIDRIAQSVLPTPAAQKRERLLEILAPREVERAIVFTRTKYGADKVAKFLGTYGLKTAVIHGNRTQGQREKALQAFKRGDVKALIATDVAARGIDIDGVSHVINFELPNVAESYVHRIGRTARAGKSGVAISLMDPAERKHLRDIEKLIKAKVPMVENIEALGFGSVTHANVGLSDEPGYQSPLRGDEDEGQAHSDKAKKGKKKDRHRDREAAKDKGKRRVASDPSRREKKPVPVEAPVEAKAEKADKAGRADKRKKPAFDPLDGNNFDAAANQPHRRGREERRDGRQDGRKTKGGRGQQGAGAAGTGTVKWFNSRKGYGFLGQDNGGPDVFVHISALEKAGQATPKEGQAFHYELAEEKTGKLSATNLRAA